MTPDGVHLHLDDHPATLELLAALFSRRGDRDTARLGYEATEHGAWVDWATLAESGLSSTERAVILIAQGCAVLERAGGLPDDLAQVVVDVVARVAPASRSRGITPAERVMTLHEEWWNALAKRLTECSVYGPESLRTSTGNAFVGDPIPSPGRQLPDWQVEACAESIVKLEDAGFTIRDTLAAAELVDEESITGSPVIGGANVVVDDVVVTIAVYIDDAAEIYPRISSASWPGDLE